MIPSLEHISLATKCLEYFCFQSFAANLQENEYDSFILKGTYAFMNYAFVSWVKHIINGLHEFDDGKPLDGYLEQGMKNLVEVLDPFIDLHWRPPRKRPKVPKSILTCVKLLKLPHLQDQLLFSLSSVDNMAIQEISHAKSFITLDLFDTVRQIQGHLEKLAVRTQHVSALRHFYGERLFKCSRMYCYRYHEGFDTVEERDEHVQKHDRSFYCPHPGCSHARLGCATARELESHIMTYHNPNPTDNDFPAEESQEKPRVQKPPATFHCHLCPKKFTRAFNLRSHLRTHTDERPFACSVCNRSFPRRHDCKTHEALHSGIKEFVCIWKLESGKEIGCGRRFSRKTAILRHLRSEAGRDCMKSPLEETDAVQQTTGVQEQREAQIQTTTDFLTQEDSYTGRNSFDASSGGELDEDLDTDEMAPPQMRID